MARTNELQVGRFNRLAQKLLSMKGSASLATLDPDLHMEIPLFHGVENRYLEAWDLFGFNAVVASGVGVTAKSQLRNPNSANVMVVVEYLGVFGPTADQPTLNFQWNLSAASDQATIFTIFGFDTRSGNQPSWRGTAPNPGRQSSAVLSGGTAAIAGATTQVMQTTSFGANGNATFIGPGAAPELLIPGGCAMTVNAGNSNNGNLTVFWRWRERSVEESERG